MLDNRTYLLDPHDEEWEIDPNDDKSWVVSALAVALGMSIYFFLHWFLGGSGC